MIGLDTHVLLRLFIEDDPAQCERARGFVDKATENDLCVVNPVVLSEFAWMLAKRMKRTRAEVASLVEKVLSADDLEIPHRNAASVAVIAYRTGRADFPDYFLAEINLELGCATTATFDKLARKYKSFSPIP